MPTLVEPAPAAPPPAVRPRVRPYRLTSARFARMVEADAFPHDAKVELLGGLLARKRAAYPPHGFAVEALRELLRRLLPDGWIVRQEKPIRLGPYWHPEPDLAVVRGPLGRYRSAFAGPADVALFVEVADSSLAVDRGPKLRAYAGAGIAEYWVVDLAGRRVEVHAAPSGRADEPGYRSVAVYEADSAVPVAIEGVGFGVVAVADILP